MRRILKNYEPSVFSSWKAQNPLAGYADLKRRNNLARSVKSDLRRYLLREQHFLCCYCECRIDEPDFHIEHFKPKDASLFPELQLEYTNLHACCHANSIGGEDESCGHRKGNYYSPLLVSPLETDCEAHFSYLLDGRMEGLDDRGTLTIEMLNLNSNLLCESRKKLIDFFLDDMNEEMRDSAIESHLNPDQAQYGEYYSMIELLFRK